MSYFLCYLLWAITGALGFLDLIAARSLSLTVMGVVSLSRWVAPAIDKFIFLTLGILWLALVIFCEYYYRRSLLKKKLWQSFFLITGIELLFLFLAHITPHLLIGLRGLNWFNLLIIAGGEGGGGAVLLFLALRSLDQRKISRG